MKSAQKKSTHLLYLFFLMGAAFVKNAYAESVVYRFHPPVYLVNQLTKKLPQGTRISAPSRAYCPLNYEAGRCKINLDIIVWPKNALAPEEVLPKMITEIVDGCRNKSCNTQEDGFSKISYVIARYKNQNFSIEVRD